MTALELHDSYEICRRMQRRHDPTYYWATRRLPREIRPAVHALYGYVRTADQMVDGPDRPAAPATRRAALDAWEQQLHEGLTTGRTGHPVIEALIDAGHRHDLPLDGLAVYMRSMRIDCAPVRMGTWEELVDYMEGSAGAVGRIMAPLLGAPRSHVEGFARLGRAFQLTNFIRDVREDYALDRLYLPAEDCRRFGVSEADIASGRATDGFRGLIALQVARARALFTSTTPAVAAVSARVRPGIRFARSVYLGVLDRVETLGGDVLGTRPTPTPWRVGRAALTALLPAVPDA